MMRRGYARAAASCLLLALLAGCKTTENLVKEISGEQTYEGFSGRFIEVAPSRLMKDGGESPMIAAAEALGGRLAGADMTYGLGGKVRRAEGEGGVRVEGGEPLEDYMVRILGTLLEPWREERPDLQVRLTPDLDFRAETDKDGVITVSLGVFLQCESEDELAFILAHEASHALLRHHESNRYNEAQKRLTDITANTLAVVLSKRDSKNADSRTLNLNAWGMVEAYQVMQTTIFDPAWNREQEDEADLLAVDLITAAGYNNSVYQIVLERLHLADERRAAEQEAERKEVEKRITAVMESGHVVEGFGMALNQMFKAPTAIVGHVVAEAGSDHPSAEGRENNLTGYVVREIDTLGDSAALPLRVDAYEKQILHGKGGKLLAKHVYVQRAGVLIEEGDLAAARKLLLGLLNGPKDTNAVVRYKLYQLYEKEGSPDKAMANLELAAKDRRAPVKVFTALIEAHGRNGDWQRALAGLDAMDARFGRRRGNLPLRLEFLLQDGRLKEAQQVMTECRASQNRDTVAGCNAAWSQHTKPSMRKASL
ncbi:M48 family metalloprotease [Oleispirillum naphthae]|uniref:M48 family metalloprotease n=1 Tax=Oleispirillum naphthae TaxID=2838853 RepID=UPI0030825E10